jgi:hypothetical protein
MTARVIPAPRVQHLAKNYNINEPYNRSAALPDSALFRRSGILVGLASRFSDSSGGRGKNAVVRRWPNWRS